MPVTLQMQAEADVSDAINAFHSVGDAAGGAGAAFEQAGSSGGGLIGKITGGLGSLISLANPVGLVTSAVTTLGPALLNAGKAAGDEQQEIDQLTNTLKNSVPGWDGNTAAIDEAIAAGQRKAFADSDLRASLGLLATDTGDVQEAIRLQGLAMDLAASKGIPLSQATKLISKADDESYSALSKLGIEIEKGTSREAALAAIHEKTAGAADVFANSAEGAGIRIQATFSDAIEQIGTAVLPALSTALGGVADFLSGPTFSTAVTFVTGLLTDGLGSALSFLQGIAGPVIAAVQPLVDAIMGIGAGATGATGPLDGFKSVLDAAQGFIVTTVVPILGQLASFLAENLPGAITAVSGFWTGTLQPAIAGVWSFVSTTVFPIIGTLLGWLADQIPPAITALAGFWTGTLQPAINAVWSFVSTTVFPIAQTLLDWLATNLPPAISALAGFWTGTLQPAINAVWSFVSTTVFPIIAGLISWLAEKLQPAITGLANFWTQTLQPAISGVWTFVQTTIFPIIQTLFNWLSVTIPPAIQTLADFWTGTLQPALQTVWDFLDKNILPILGSLIVVGITPVQTAVSALAGVWNTVLAPALTKVADTWNTTLKPAAEGMASFFGGALKGAIDSVGSAINGVIQFLKDLANGLANVKLPDWMTPGSPTPWEIGLVGVGKAMRDLTGGPLPTLARQLDALPAPGTLTVGAGRGGLAVLPAPAGTGAGAGGETYLSATIVLPDGTVVGTVKNVKMTGRKLREQADLKNASYR